METTDTIPACDRCGAVITWVGGRRNYYRCANGHYVTRPRSKPSGEGPITGIVPSSELSTETLRAQDYLINPKEEAKAVVKEWLEVTGMKRVINPNSQYMKRLYALISAAIASAYKRGASQQLQCQPSRYLVKNAGGKA